MSGTTFGNARGMSSIWRGLTKPGPQTGEAVAHPNRAAIQVAVSCFVIVSLGGLTAGGFPWTILVGVAVGALGYAFIRLSFRTDGWATHWYQRNRSSSQ